MHHMDFIAERSLLPRHVYPTDESMSYLTGRALNGRSIAAFDGNQLQRPGVPTATKLLTHSEDVSGIRRPYYLGTRELPSLGEARCVNQYCSDTATIFERGDPKTIWRPSRGKESVS